VVGVIPENMHLPIIYPAAQSVFENNGFTLLGQREGA